MPVRLAEIIVRNQICSLRISAVHHLNPFPLCHHQKHVPSSLDLSVWECFRLLLPSFTYGATKTRAIVFFDNTTSCALTCTLVFLKQGLVDLTCEVTALIDIDFPDSYLIALHGRAVWMNENLEFVSQGVCSCDQHAEMSEPASLLCLSRKSLFIHSMWALKIWDNKFTASMSSIIYNFTFWFVSKRQMASKLGINSVVFFFFLLYRNGKIKSFYCDVQNAKPVAMICKAFQLITILSITVLFILLIILLIKIEHLTENI